jgi:cysteine-rich repeat protein
MNGSGCALCSSLIPGCLTCSSNTTCTMCDTANHFQISGSVCGCASGYALNGLVCGTCAAVMPRCLTCSSNTTCTMCDTANHFQISGSVCGCVSGYTLNGSTCATCASSMSECLLCSSNSVCTSCSSGFTLNTSTCQEICGDGILFVLPCDDGNNVNGDGCSSTCHIEPGYTCSGGSSTSRSVCSASAQVKVILSEILKDVYSNSVSFVFTLDPPLQLVDGFNFTALVSSNIPASTTTAVYSSGTLKVSVSYTANIQNIGATFMFQPPVSQTMSLSVNPQNAPAYFYQETTYDTVNRGKTVLIVCLAVSVIFLVLSLWQTPMIGLHMMHTLQTFFLSASLVLTIEASFACIEAFYGVNGYNRLFRDRPSAFDFGPQPTLTKSLVLMGVGARFLQNCNIMIIANLFLGLVGGVLYLISIWTNSAKESLEKTAKYIMNELFLILGIFNSMNVGFSFGLQALYWTQP